MDVSKEFFEIIALCENVINDQCQWDYWKCFFSNKFRTAIVSDYDAISGTDIYFLLGNSLYT